MVAATTGVSAKTTQSVRADEDSVTKLLSDNDPAKNKKEIDQLVRKLQSEYEKDPSIKLDPSIKTLVRMNETLEALNSGGTNLPGSKDSSGDVPAADLGAGHG